MNTISTILKEMQTVCMDVSPEEYDSLVHLLKEDSRFFFTGEGRSGFVAKAIAMRLMHSGKTVYVVGETTTPAIRESDILIVLSGSGKTAQALNISESAHHAGAIVFMITTNAEALQLPFISGGVRLPAATKYRLEGEPETIQPLGNQFDQSAHLVMDAAIIDSLAEGKTNEELRKKHSNLE